MTGKTLHFGVTIISRNKERPDNAVAACAYRSGQKLHDEKQEIKHNYANRHGILAAEIFAPELSPEWMKQNDWERFGNEIEKAEDKHNRHATALLAKDFQVAAPRELTDEQNWQLAQDFAAKFNERGLAVAVAFHKSQASDGGDNPHFHFLVPMREVNEQGFGRRYRKLDGVKGGKDTEIMKLRREYYACVNGALSDAGIRNITYDAEKQEGVKPKAHLGKHATQLEREGVKTIFGEYNRKVDIDNFMDKYSKPIKAEWEASQKNSRESVEKYRSRYQLNRGSAMAARDATQKTQSNVTTPPISRTQKAIEQARERAILSNRQSKSFVDRTKESKGWDRER